MVRRRVLALLVEQGHVRAPVDRDVAAAGDLEQPEGVRRSLLDREVAGLPAHQTGNVRLSNAQYRAGLGLRESSVLDQAVDLQREARLELLTLGVGKTEVGKDVAAALFNSNLVLLLHLGSSPI